MFCYVFAHVIFLQDLLFENPFEGLQKLHVCCLGRSSAAFGLKMTLLVALGALLGALLAALGALLAALGRSWAALGRSWPLLGRSWPLLAALGLLLVALRRL